VLRNQLAVGRAPRRPIHLDRLEQEGVRGVLSLCAVDEAPPPEDLDRRFHCRRVVLPDHRTGRAPEPAELELALQHLAALLASGPVYVHCVAGVERSPLICLAWLMRVRQLPLLDALDYLMQVHPGTGPLPEQLASLQELSSFTH
jgi:protein-tyrosine phosphatase